MALQIETGPGGFYLKNTDLGETFGPMARDEAERGITIYVLQKCSDLIGHGVDLVDRIMERGGSHGVSGISHRSEV